MTATMLTGLVGGLIAIVLIGVVYFTPTIVASRRRHPNEWAIFATNLLLGWTVIIWIAALIWALSNPPKVTVVAPAPTTPRVGIADELFKLADLRARGLLSEDEFQAQRSKLLGST